MTDSGSHPQHFPLFVNALRQRFGEAAIDVRHELFFLTAGRNKALVPWRAVVALLRDAWLLFRGSVPSTSQVRGKLVLLATLPGGNGWGTLARAVEQLPPSLEVVVLAHPRLDARVFPSGMPLLRPAHPSLGAAWEGIVTFFQQLGRSQSPTLASCLARRILWRSSLARTLAGSESLLLLHNDFDLMSRAAVDQGLITICLQHGLPTDEFFPSSADWLVLWGKSSHAAFVAAGTSASRLVEDSLGQGFEASLPVAVPEGLSLVSQTHAPIFGPALVHRLREFADGLLQLEPSMRLLLHPQERPSYEGAAAQASCRAPHPELRPGGCPARLVLGCCSTALFDAARAGHWVARLRAPLVGNVQALKVLELPMEVESPEQALQLYQRLRDDPHFRSHMAQAQMEWLQQSFTRKSGGLRELIMRLTQDTAKECHA